MRWTFGHAHLIASDVDGAADFYVRMFGAALVNRGQVSGKAQAWLDLEGTLLIIRGRRPTDELAEVTNTRIDHFGPRVDDLERAAADLKARGVRCTGGNTTLLACSGRGFTSLPRRAILRVTSIHTVRLSRPSPLRGGGSG